MTAKRSGLGSAGGCCSSPSRRHVRISWIRPRAFSTRRQRCSSAACALACSSSSSASASRACATASCMSAATSLLRGSTPHAGCWPSHIPLLPLAHRSVSRGRWVGRAGWISTEETERLCRRGDEWRRGQWGLGFEWGY
jgi:hypothetical protein